MRVEKVQEKTDDACWFSPENYEAPPLNLSRDEGGKS